MKQNCLRKLDELMYVTKNLAGCSFIRVRFFFGKCLCVDMRLFKNYGRKFGYVVYGTKKINARVRLLLMCHQSNYHECVFVANGDPNFVKFGKKRCLIRIT